MQNKIQLTKSRSMMHILFVLLAVAALTMVAACDEPTPAERMENAADDLGDGIEDAAEEMQDRSPAEKMGDAIEDAGEEIQDAAE
jgi:ABC-type transporter MlaC component